MMQPVRDLELMESARLTRPTVAQIIVAVLVCGCLGAAVFVSPAKTLGWLMIAAWTAFSMVGVWRTVVLVVGIAPMRPKPLIDRQLPPYTIIIALRHEAEIVPLLVERLARLDYPPDRLQGLIAVEADDAETIEAVCAVRKPDWLSLVTVPDGKPRTKPRALNHALERATGTLVTVYDAEDEPHPDQLREAAARFAKGGRRLACLQAPLRIRRIGTPTRRSPLLDRQFAAEYAALFEVMLPAYARLGLPFPLGGTSNHFRADALRSSGGWDAWNVTEDADLGFRLWRQGWRLGVIGTPTMETPPGRIRHWLPQRTRWLKGYMQTWGVHMRRPFGLGWRGNLAIQLSLGMAILSAPLYAPTVFALTALVMAAALAGGVPHVPLAALGVLSGGTVLAWATCWLGTRRAGARYGFGDMLFAPFYWSLQSLAFVHAAWRLIREPHAWDKTDHPVDAEEQTGPETA